MWRIKQGFTLVELLVVMGVIGVLATIVTLTAIGTNIQRGNDAHRKADLESVRSALELYYNDNRSYPSDVDYPTMVNDLKTNGYLQSIPADPVSANSYYYTPLNNNTTYQLCAFMETSCGANCGSCNGSCGAATCNYLVTQP